MIKKKIAIIFGVRPHFVKLSALIPELEKEFELVLIHTGQHYDNNMCDVFYSQFNLASPHYNLGVSSVETPSIQIAKGMIKLEPILINIEPNWVMVIGDANPALVGALVASKLKIPIVHVEAGSYSTCTTFKSPEEINRNLVDSISTVYFCPTLIAKKNLENKGVSKHNYFVGDLLMDVYLNNRNLKEKITSNVKQLIDELVSYNLVTIHREENIKNVNNLKNIIDALLRIKENIIFPLHPRTKQKLIELNLIEKIYQSPYIKIIEPVSYIDMLNLIVNAKIVLTDSSGIQREAYISYIPSVILRNHNEYPEMINTACSIFAGSDTNKIIESVKYNICSLEKSFNRKLFGDGDTAKKITNILSKIHIEGSLLK